MPRKEFKYGVSARRFFIRTALGLLGDAMTHREQQARHRTFLQAQRFAQDWARPALEAHPELFDQLDEIPTTTDELAQTYAGIQHPDWAKVCIWVEAWYRDDVFGAQPRDTDLEADEILDPDPSQTSHYFARRSYREAVSDALQTQADAIQTTDGSLANALYDWTYPYVVAVAWPVLQRLEKTLTAVTDLWHDGIPEDESNARARRMDTVSELILGWHRSGVFSQPAVPHDDASRDDLLEVIQGDTHPLEDLQP